MSSTVVRFCPAQQRALETLERGLKVGTIFRLWGGTGKGKTTLLRHLKEQLGGAYIGLKDIVASSRERHPLGVEDTVFEHVREALETRPIVILDDADLLDYGHCSHFYPRRGYFDSMVAALCNVAIERGRKLIFGTTGHLAESAEERSYSFGIERFKPEDYASLVATWQGADVASALDFQKIYRFAPRLNAHQLKAACAWLANGRGFATDSFIEYLRSQRLASNVDLDEVQAVDLRDLKGVDDVLRNLEINIVLPLENDEIASKYALRSKRGVLLYGPPGTGKTTIGRALAHRLKSKFFLIDGTFIAGSNEFYDRIQRVFEAAKDNAPAIIFIDDADSIFEDGEERGLYRYLLTMLDGLESESAGRVCVIMTAMNVADLPPALIRSGRVELWLEMRLPDSAARNTILLEHARSLPEEMRKLDVRKLVTATDGFTGADLKRAIEDGKAIYAYDKARGNEMRPLTNYFLEAIEAVNKNKQRHSEAIAQAIEKKRADPSFPNVVRHYVRKPRRC